MTDDKRLQEAEDRLLKAADEITTAYLKARKRNPFEKSWGIRDTDGDRVVVVVFIRRAEMQIKMATRPSGEPCACCGGTGRI